MENNFLEGKKLSNNVLRAIKFETFSTGFLNWLSKNAALFKLSKVVKFLISFNYGKHLMQIVTN